MTGATGASAQAISHHYDISNDFYQLWLDPSMTYSSALWDSATDLHSAQLAKLDWHLAHLHLQPGQRLLDIGCGWGGLLERAEYNYGVRGTGLTLSPAQKEWADRVPHPMRAIRLENWQDHVCDELYHGILSIGAFEHFAKQGLSKAERSDNYRHFFEQAHAWLVPGGSLSLQTIGCGNMLRTDFSTFFATEIFPESDLPCLDEIISAMQFLFEVKLVRNDRHDYAKTLRLWLSNLSEHKASALEMVGPTVVTRYLKYFKLAIISFEQAGTMELYRLALKRIDNPRDRR